MIYEESEATYMPPAVRNAYDTVALWEENQSLRARLVEAEEWRERYWTLLNGEIKRSHTEIAGWLTLILENKITVEKRT